MYVLKVFKLCSFITMNVMHMQCFLDDMVMLCTNSNTHARHSLMHYLVMADHDRHANVCTFTFIFSVHLCCDLLPCKGSKCPICSKTHILYGISSYKMNYNITTVQLPVVRYQSWILLHVPWETHAHTHQKHTAVYVFSHATGYS